MSKPPHLNYRPMDDGRYEVWLHAVVTQDALLGLHGVLAQYDAEAPPESAPEADHDGASGKEIGADGASANDDTEMDGGKAH
ncbi:MAG: hypothetical protein MH112_01335 [Phenylobacterium sp.]|uniref:hypothetical protein n=1 Tax=Phenylobacterium sp. TaxID=1871053 RepID=UPI0025EC6E08|nr:hypothetical protein [Phenylobacterium sp.]MCG9914988.1 hypothetical protein [Phenylobacterium sp.]